MPIDGGSRALGYGTLTLAYIYLDGCVTDRAFRDCFYVCT